MKKQTKTKKQIELVEKHLKTAREYLQEDYIAGKTGEYYLLVSVEKLLEVVKTINSDETDN